MTSPSLLVATALLALLVGAALPVLYQLYQTLKRARAFLDTAGPQVEKTLDQVGRAAHRLDRIGSSLEAPVQTLRPLLVTASNVGLSIARSGDWLRTAASVGGAVAPAVIAGVQAFFSRAAVRRKREAHLVDRESKGNGADT
jgi:uncharacterized protein YoxC